MGQTPEETNHIASRHAVMIERLKSGYFVPFNQTLNRLDKATREALMSLDVEKISDLPKRELDILIAELRTLAHDLMDVQVGKFVDDLSEFATSEAAFEVKALEAVTFDVEITSPPAGSPFTYANNLPIRATGELPKRFFSGMTSSEMDNLAMTVRKAYVDGLTIPQTVARVHGTRVAQYKDGFTKQAKRRVETQVRTATSHYANLSREDVWRRNSDIVEGYSWLSTLDSRTSAICRSLSGREFEVGKGPRPPQHPGCRSVTVPILDDSLDFLDKDATQASQFGPVDADLDYYSWLRTQSAAFQNEAIGPVRAKLMRDGGLTADKFAKLNLGRNFEPLTLAEMQAKSPLAFERAGIET